MRTAIYPGSFDPITNGHLDVVRRAHALFGRVIVAVAHTPRKTGLFAPEERIRLICESLNHVGLTDCSVAVDSFSCLLTDYARRQGPTVIVRGLRAVADFEFEFQFAMANKALWVSDKDAKHAPTSELEFIHLMTGKDNLYTSSSLVREIAHFGGDVSRFVPPPVKEALERKYGKRSDQGA